MRNWTDESHRGLSDVPEVRYPPVWDGEVSNHYGEKHWGLSDVPEVRYPPVWDEDTPEDAVDRLEAAFDPGETGS